MCKTAKTQSKSQMTHQKNAKMFFENGSGQHKILAVPLDSYISNMKQHLISDYLTKCFDAVLLYRVIFYKTLDYFILCCEIKFSKHEMYI